MQRIRARTIKTAVPDRRPRMRLIKEAIAELKAADEKTALTEYALRRMVKLGQVPSVHIGNRHLVNMDILERYLQGEQ